MYEDLVARDELIAIVIIVLGVILARLASMATGAVLGFLDRHTSRFATSGRTFIAPRLVVVSRAIVFWLVVILAISFALRLLGVGNFQTMLNAVIVFVPQLLVGFTIVVAGHVVGLLAGQLIENMGDGMSSTSLAPRVAYGAIFLVAVVMGLQQINVDISFLTQLMLILIAIVGGGLMLAFALGARQHVANLLARRELSRFAVGDRIRVDEIEGDIVDLHATGVDIATDEGTVSIPASRLAETFVLRRSEAESSG